MSHAVFIEVLARNGEVLQRHRFTQLPVRIGRAYDNDLIIDDPYIAPHHAKVEEVHGELIMRAKNTRNGLVSGRHRKNLLDLDGNTQVRLGHTRLRVRRADHPVAPEIPDSTNHGWEGWLPAFCGLGIMVVVALIDQWLRGTTATKALGLFTEASSNLVLLLLWSGLWALANRLFSGSARLGRHLFIAGCGYLLGELWLHSASILAYAFSWEFLSRYDDVFFLLPVALALYFHLITVNPRLPRRMGVITLGILLAVNTMMLTNTYLRTGTLANRVYMSAPYPPALRLSDDISLDAFLERAEHLQPALESLREKAETN